MDTGLLLEDWLHRAASPPSQSSSSPSPNHSAQQIARNWSLLRQCAQSGSFNQDHLTALVFLRDCGRTLHLADAQGKTLVSVINNLSSHTDYDVDSRAQALESAALLLSIWLRRSNGNDRGSKIPSPSPSLETLISIVDSTVKIVKSSSSSYGTNEAILLLGTLCLAPNVSEELRCRCQDVISKQLLSHKEHIRQGNLKNALSGVGYAMISSSGSVLTELVQGVLLLFEDNLQIPSLPSLHDMLMVLNLMEWFTRTLAMSSRSHHLTVFLQIVVEEIIRVGDNCETIPKRSTVVMSAAGILRSFHLSKIPTLSNLEPRCSRIISLLDDLIIKMVDTTLQMKPQMVAEDFMKGISFKNNNLENQTCIPILEPISEHWFQCVALAVSRCTKFPPSLSILYCLTVTLLHEAFPLLRFYSRTVVQQNFNLKQNHEGLSHHVEHILFHESGTIFRTLCDQFLSADQASQLWIEKMFSQYSHFIYHNHRHYLARISQGDLLTSSSLVADSENKALRKVHEAALLSVVLLSSLASKQKTDADIIFKGQFAAQVLSSLSCLEFIRQGLIPEYGDLVKTCVSWASTNEATSAMLISMCPSYNDIVAPPGYGMPMYDWRKDSVQDVRVLFCFRVLPSCIQNFPASSFLESIAPVMFLYMKHPNENISNVSYSLLVSFLSANTGQKLTHVGNHTLSFKEQVAMGFIDSMLEEFPCITHYDAFVKGIGAIARYLPAGSSATVYCMDALTRRATVLFSSESTEDSDEDNHKAEIENGKKLQTLLLHLILIVDIQVLPHLLKEVAGLILGLPLCHRMHALEEAFDILAGSDDLTRKHVIVPWLQSLSYLCSNPDVQQSSMSPSRNGKSPNNDDGADNVLVINPSSGHRNNSSRSRM